MEKNNEELFCFGLLVSDCVEKFFCFEDVCKFERIVRSAQFIQKCLHRNDVLLMNIGLVPNNYARVRIEVVHVLKEILGKASFSPNLLSCRCASDTFECPHVLALGRACVQRLMKFYVDFRVCP